MRQKTQARIITVMPKSTAVMKTIALAKSDDAYTLIMTEAVNSTNIAKMKLS